MVVSRFLDPLTPDELRLCSAAVRAYFNGGDTPHRDVRFNTVQTLEPPKRDWVAAGGIGGVGARSPPPRRAARVVVSVGCAFFELDLLLLSLTPTATARVAACRPIDLTKGQPLATAEDCLLAESIARGDPHVAAACARALKACSSSDYAQTKNASVSELMERYVALDPWALHHCPQEWYSAGGGGGTGTTTAPRRVMQVFAYEKPSPLHNEYARPLPVTAAVDLCEQRVIQIEEWLWEQQQQQDRRRPIHNANGGDGEFAPQLLPHPPRSNPPKPLRTSQPEGPSFYSPSNDPWRVLWQGWDFRVSFNAREGLVLYDVSFAPRGGGGGGSGQGGTTTTTATPIAHRLSIAEMCVPYSDPRPPYNRRCALDAGDYGLGAAAVPQSACADCAGGGDVRYFSPCLADAQGEPRIIQNAVCLHEVDAGVLWKHADYRTGEGPVRRARELVVGFATVAVNYDYLFSWVLGLDGSIRLEVRLTGVLSTNRLTRAEAMATAAASQQNATGDDQNDGLPTHGTLVAPRVVAGHHQHLFCARLDLAVGDRSGGQGLVVSEVDPLPAPAVDAAAAAAASAGNDAGNGFSFRETRLPTLNCPGRDPSIGRVWRVSDPRSLHPRSRRPRSYELRLSSPATMLASAGSSAAKRALFATKSLWVTPHEDGELFPTGKYAMNSREDTGPMARWCRRQGGDDRRSAADSNKTDANDNKNADPVLWVTFGVTHEVRVEDYPVMPRDVCSIELRPYNFLDAGNPAVDLPAPDSDDGAREVAARSRL